MTGAILQKPGEREGGKAGSASLSLGRESARAGRPRGVNHGWTDALGLTVKKPHKNLDVWAVSMELARRVYRLTAAYPDEERFGLVSQMRRAAVSIPSNIAEGAARDSNNEFRNFLSIARSSLSELDTQLDLSCDLGFVPERTRAEVDDLLLRVDQMLYALHRLKKSVRA